MTVRFCRPVCASARALLPLGGSATDGTSVTDVPTDPSDWEEQTGTHYDRKRRPTATLALRRQSSQRHDRDGQEQHREHDS